MGALPLHIWKIKETKIADVILMFVECFSNVYMMIGICFFLLAGLYSNDKRDKHLSKKHI